MDVLTVEQRSFNMSRIKDKDTNPEIAVRSILHQMGYRFRLHRKNLPGKPDIVLPKYKTVILIHGCFWHRHKGCPYSTTPKTRQSKWQKKFDENVARDKRNERELIKLGWKVLTIWECEVKRNPENVAKKLEKFLTKDRGAYAQEK